MPYDTYKHYHNTVLIQPITILDYTYTYISI